MSSSGSAPPSRRIRWPRSTASPRQLAEQNVLGDDVDIDIHAFDETNSRIRPDRIARLIEAAGAGMVMMVGVQSNQVPRTLDLSRPLRAARHPGRHRRLPHVGRHLHARRRRRRAGAKRRRWASRSSPARPKAASTRCCATPTPGTLKPLYNFMDDLPGDRGRADPAAQARARAAHRRRGDELRRRPRLPLPVLVLHHHQRAGPQVAPPLARRRRGDRARQRRAGPAPLLHHRRQFRPQQGLGGDPRSPDPSARGREAASSG